MYSSTPGMGAGPVVSAAGIAALPNTNGNGILLVTSLLTIFIGVAILATSIIRTVVKKAQA